MNASTPDSGQNKGDSNWVQGLMWWTTLLVAVLAVPVIGTSVALGLTESAFLQMVIFVLTCWACTWLGMWLMKKAENLKK